MGIAGMAAKNAHMSGQKCACSVYGRLRPHMCKKVHTGSRQASSSQSDLPKICRHAKACTKCMHRCSACVYIYMHGNVMSLSFSIRPCAGKKLSVRGKGLTRHTGKSLQVW